MHSGNRSDRKPGICRDDGGGGNRTRERFLPRQGWVYLIDDGGWSYKIGYARNPEKRLPFIQTGAVEPLRLVGVINAPRSLERELHELFAADRIRGEWFTRSKEMLGFFEDHGWICICPGDRRRSEPVDVECFIHGEDQAAW